MTHGWLGLTPSTEDDGIFERSILEQGVGFEEIEVGFLVAFLVDGR